MPVEANYQITLSPSQTETIPGGNHIEITKGPGGKVYVLAGGHPEEVTDSVTIRDDVRSDVTVFSAPDTSSSVGIKVTPESPPKRVATSPKRK